MQAVVRRSAAVRVVTFMGWSLWRVALGSILGFSPSPQPSPARGEGVWPCRLALLSEVHIQKSRHWAGIFVVRVEG